MASRIIDPKTGLSEQSKRLLDDYAATGAAVASAHSAKIAHDGRPYASVSSAAHAARRIITSVPGRAYLLAAAAKAKATPDRALARVGAALDAQKPVVSNEGQIVAQINDWSTQLKASDMIFKIHGSYQQAAPATLGGTVDVPQEIMDLVLGEDETWETEAE